VVSVMFKVAGAERLPVCPHKDLCTVNGVNICNVSGYSRAVYVGSAGVGSCIHHMKDR